jgi:hypothetical protein
MVLLPPRMDVVGSPHAGTTDVRLVGRTRVVGPRVDTERGSECRAAPDCSCHPCRGPRILDELRAVQPAWRWHRHLRIDEGPRTRHAADRAALFGRANVPGTGGQAWRRAGILAVCDDASAAQAAVVLETATTPGLALLIGVSDYLSLDGFAAAGDVLQVGCTRAELVSRASRRPSQCRAGSRSRGPRHRPCREPSESTSRLGHWG